MSVVEDVASISAGLARQRDIRIDTAVAPDIGAVHLDPTRFKQVLYNYLSNAIKFSREHGRVEVRIRADGPDHFCLDVQDWGIGIKQEDMQPAVHRVPATGCEHPLNTTKAQDLASR